MRMRHFADLVPSDIEMEWDGYADNGKQFALGIAKTYKWDSWIDIQTEFDLIDKPTTKEQD